MFIDINCDLGESFGAYTLGNDEALMPFITSANIACGMHAGDPRIMHQTVQTCVRQGVAIGAHPGFADLSGFGRRTMGISPAEAYDLVLYQIGALYGFVKAAGARLHHVKPHGALYNQAAKDPALAEAIARAVKDFDSQLFLYGLAGSALVEEAKRLGVRTCSEIFADRTYQPDGNLTPRTSPNALIHDPAQAVGQVMQFIREKENWAETVCIHGDGPQAVSFARALYTHFQEQGIQPQSPLS